MVGVIIFSVTWLTQWSLMSSAIPFLCSLSLQFISSAALCHVCDFRWIVYRVVCWRRQISPLYHSSLWKPFCSIPLTIFTLSNKEKRNQVWVRLQPLWIAWSCIKGFIPKHHFGGSRGQRSKYPQPRYPSMKMFLPSHSGSLLAMAFYGSSQGGARWERDDGGCNTIVIFLISTEFTEISMAMTFLVLNSTKNRRM